MHFADFGEIFLEVVYESVVHAEESLLVGVVQAEKCHKCVVGGFVDFSLLGTVLLHEVFEALRDEFFLVLEKLIDGTFGHAQLLGKLVHRNVFYAII